MIQSPTPTTSGTSPTPNGTNTRIQIPTTAQSMSIGQDGAVTFVDEAGDLRYAGHLVLAKFPNPGGIEKVGGNYFEESANSGVPVRNIPTQGGIGNYRIRLPRNVQRRPRRRIHRNDCGTTWFPSEHTNHHDIRRNPSRARQPKTMI